MNAGRLLAHYEKIAEAPDAIPRLRRFILDLAVRGKLVKQDPNDEPASVLLKRMQGERRKCVANGEMRPERRIEAPAHNEGIFNLPSSWLWCVADNVWDLENGDRSSHYPSRDQLVPSGIPFINAGHLVNGRVSLNEMNFITSEKFNSLRGGKVRKGDQLYCLRGSLGKHAVFDIELKAAIASSLVILRPVLAECVPYFSLYLGSAVAEIMLRRFDNGSAQPNLSSANLRRFEIPLPPLAEQHRIVTKVDELMALCDRLETERTARETTRDRLTAASLARLNESDPDPAAFRNHAAFALDNLTPLTTRPDQIKALRQTILNLAVRGKLVEQDPNDEPAEELLKRIAAEKARMVEAGEIRKQKILLPVHRDDMPVEDIPGWVWVRLGEVSTMITKGSTPTSYGHAYTKQGVNFVKVESIKNGSLLSEKITSFISNQTHGFLARSQLAAGDILFSIAGSIGTCAVVTKQVLPANTNQALAIIRGTQAAFLSEFLLKSLQSSVAQSVVQKARGGAMNNISLNDIRNFVVPLPPIAEQHRIVAKVDQLMAVCDQLEARLSTGDDTRRRLLDALLHEALEETLEPVKGHHARVV